VSGSDTASIIPRWYSARLVVHRPGSALASGDSIRSWSAHSLTVSFVGGARIASVALIAFAIWGRALSLIVDRLAGEMIEDVMHPSSQARMHLTDGGCAVDDRRVLARKAEHRSAQVCRDGLPGAVNVRAVQPCAVERVGLNLGRPRPRLDQPRLVRADVIFARVAIDGAVAKIPDIRLHDRDQLIPPAIRLRQMARLRELLHAARRE
jgi:hypothetical protein